MKHKLRHRMLIVWSSFVSRHPIWVLAIAFALAIASTVYTLAELQFNPNRNDLISKDLDWNQRFIAWQAHFPGSSDFIIVVDTLVDTPEAHAKAQAMVDELGKKLSSDSLMIERVVWGFDPRTFSPRVIQMLPLEQMENQLAEVEKSKAMLASVSLESLIKKSMEEARQQTNTPATKNEAAGEPSPAQVAQSVKDIGSLDRMFLAVNHVLAVPLDEQVNFEKLITQGQDLPQWQYLTSTNGRLYFLRISPKEKIDTLSAFAPAIADIRNVMQEVQSHHPQVQAGLTGIDVVEADETDAATWDSTWTAAVAAVLITILLVCAFHSWRVPLLAMVALLVAIAWAFGFLTLSIGHLQVLSVVFTIILLGLGIDYAIHLSTTFELLRHDHPDSIEGFTLTLAQTFERCGPALVTGSLTTAVAFGMTLFTDFTGVAEMGQVAGVGIVLCLIAMATVFPAMLRLFKPLHKHVVPMEDRRLHFFEDRWVSPFVMHPRMTLVAASVLVVLSGLAVTQMHFDYDLLKLQPRGVDSVQWQQRIVERGQESIWFGVSLVDDLEQARTLAMAYRKQNLVSQKMGGVGLLFPTQEEERQALLSHTRQTLEPDLKLALNPDFEPAGGAGLSVQMAIMRQTLPSAMARPMPGAIREALAQLQATLNRSGELAMSLPGEQLNTRLARVEELYSKFRLDSAKRIKVLTDGKPLSMSDVPADLMHAYVSDRGKLALEVYPRLPENDKRVDGPLSPYFLPDFVKQLTEVDPNVTGVVVQIFKSGYLIKTSYQFAGAAALLAVLVLVWLDFRSVYDAVLTVVPVGVGFGVTFGLMWLAGMQINPANIIVLPLMFGIGVDAGVHIVHRYHQEPTRRPLGLAGGSGKGVSLTSYTTMIGFGVMIFASHRGIASLGFVLFTGIGMTLLACWSVLPAWLELRQRKVEQRGTNAL